jgi:hypothetical protein
MDWFSTNGLKKLYGEVHVHVKNNLPKKLRREKTLFWLLFFFLFFFPFGTHRQLHTSRQPPAASAQRTASRQAFLCLLAGLAAWWFPVCNNLGFWLVN